jgi:putative colanic acid biosysnthesis UDP-glucose lipid carrier transferase
MLLSRLSDIVEPRGVEPGDRTGKNSWLFKQLNISCQKIEILALIIDLLLIVLASTFGRTVYLHVWHENFATAEACLGAGIINGLSYISVARMRGLYRFPVLLMPLPYFSPLLTIFASTAFLVTGSVFSLKGNIALSFWPLVATLLLQVILLLIARWVFAIVTRAILSAGNLDGRRVVTIGEPAELMGLSESFLLQCFGRREVFRVPVATKRGYRSSEFLADLDGAIAAASEQGAEEFLVALPWGSQELLETVRTRLRASPLPVRLLPDHSMRTLLGQRGMSSDAPLLPVTLQRVALTPFERAVKRALDIVVSMAAIVFFSPLFLIAAVAVKLNNPGPIIFRQRRSGFNAKEFVIFKFRTMTVLEDGPIVTQACRDDLRVTRIGKFLRRSSLDELPQLLNVLRGDMSLVGPRPHAIAHDEEYRVHIADYAFRHHVKPGITGWAQVHGLRGETASFGQMAERVKLDLWYINNWSLGLDINILVRTCFEVLRDRAY